MHRLPKRPDHGAGNITAMESLLPFSRSSAADQRGHRSCSSGRTATIVDELRSKTDDLAKVSPESVFAGCYGQKAPVAGAVDAIARRSTGFQCVAGQRPMASPVRGRKTMLEKGEDIVEHGDLDTTSSSATRSLEQRQENVH